MSRIQSITEDVSTQASTAQTDVSLIAAVAGQSIWVHGIVVSSAVAQTITLEQGTTTRKFEVYPGVNGGISAVQSDPDNPLFKLAANTALTWTSTAAGAAFVLVQFTRR